MTKNIMKNIKTKIQQEGSIANEAKTDLLSSLSVVESEITKLSEIDSEHAQSITGFIERSTHEATRQIKKPELLKLSLAGLIESVKGLRHLTLS